MASAELQPSDEPAIEEKSEPSTTSRQQHRAGRHSTGGPMHQERTTRAGLGLALLSAATFGTSGTFATALIDAGWSPGAAVTIRIGIAALVLAIPAAFVLHGRWNILWRNIGMVAMYGLVAVAGCQVFFFNAVQHLS